MRTISSSRGPESSTLKLRRRISGSPRLSTRSASSATRVPAASRRSRTSRERSSSGPARASSPSTGAGSSKPRRRNPQPASARPAVPARPRVRKVRRFMPLPSSGDHDIDQLAGHHDHLAHRLALGVALDVLRGEGLGLDGRLVRSEEHTSELQSRPHLVCRLLLEKKKATHCLIHIPTNCCYYTNASCRWKSRRILSN